MFELAAFNHVSYLKSSARKYIYRTWAEKKLYFCTLVISFENWDNLNRLFWKCIQFRKTTGINLGEIAIDLTFDSSYLTSITQRLNIEQNFLRLPMLIWHGFQSSVHIRNSASNTTGIFYCSFFLYCSTSFDRKKRNKAQNWKRSPCFQIFSFIETSSKNYKQMLFIVVTLAQFESESPNI